jgi:hypothetical protein
MRKSHFPDWDPVELLRRFFSLTPQERAKEFLTPAATSVRLELSDARVRQLADEGVLAHVKPTGGRIYIHWPTVLKALEFAASQR